MEENMGTTPVIETSTWIARETGMDESEIHAAVLEGFKAMLNGATAVELAFDDGPDKEIVLKQVERLNDCMGMELVTMNHYQSLWVDVENVKAIDVANA
jgi:hypothetical protein